MTIVFMLDNVSQFTIVDTTKVRVLVVIFCYSLRCDRCALFFMIMLDWFMFFQNKLSIAHVVQINALVSY